MRNPGSNRRRQEAVDRLNEMLDQAEIYLSERQIEQSGTLSATVFESALRRIARENGIETATAKLGRIISKLKSAGVIDKAVVERCRATASVGNETLHANWEGLSLEEIMDVIRLTRQLVQEHLEP